ncbi:NAD+ synthase [Aliikangiella marina]|nr:NAD+ synthase [Aliikangiella marina]
MKITLAQLNYTVGDVQGNFKKILKEYEKVADEAGLLICSELAISGYYPQDLILRKVFLDKHDSALNQLIEATKGKACKIVVGFIARNETDGNNKHFNALGLIANGKLVFEYHKRLLPTYNVFDEARHFKPGEETGVFEVEGKRVGFLVCEDAWAKSTPFEYAQDPVEDLRNQHLDLVIVINASPSNIGKQQERYQVVSEVAEVTKAPVVYLNQVGGNDELVFDGASFVVDNVNQLAIQLEAFVEQTNSFELSELVNLKANPIALIEEDFYWQQTVLGIRDYVRKCGFERVVIGSSGGIDSAVTIAICAKALGPENVTAVTMPSKFSSQGSVDDSVDLCANLGVKLLNASIAEEFKLSVERFESVTGEVPSRITQENIQARIRGRILMEFSNHYGGLVISTGNKSEMSVGYATLYGDMNGGVNPLGDLYKMEVYAIAKYINSNAGREIIPINIIEKEPSAELSEDQKDSDSLPPYPLLDAILELYIEGDLLIPEERSRCERIVEEFAATEEEISRIQRMVNNAEFKRKQAPPIIRVQKRSFGMGRWLPVAARY